MGQVYVEVDKPYNDARELQVEVKHLSTESSSGGHALDDTMYTFSFSSRCKIELSIAVK